MLFSLPLEEARYAPSHILCRHFNGVRNVWTKDGNIFSFNEQNKVFVIPYSKDLDNLNVSYNYVPIIFPDLEV